MKKLKWEYRTAGTNGDSNYKYWAAVIGKLTFIIDREISFPKKTFYILKRLGSKSIPTLPRTCFSKLKDAKEAARVSL